MKAEFVRCKMRKALIAAKTAEREAIEQLVLLEHSGL